MMTKKRRLCKIGGLLAIILTVTMLSACSVPEALPTFAPSPNPSPSPAPQPAFTPAVPSPTAAPGISPAPAISPALTPTPSPTPTGPNLELKQYIFDLINKDRQAQGLGPVVLAYNTASQKHAEDMLANYYLSHWDTDGLKPYMRYSLAGGFNGESENSAYSGWFNRTDNPELYAVIDAKKELNSLQYKMMNEDAASNWGHRNTILNKWHKKVSIGIAYDKHRLALVQQFEGYYVQFTNLPVLTQSTLSLSGVVSLGAIKAVALYYDPLPQPKTPQELTSGPRSYGLGKEVGQVIAPAPPGQYYTNLPADAIQAGKWDVNHDGSFSIQADVSLALAGGKGVYTVVIWVNTPAEQKNVTNYSLFVR